MTTSPSDSARATGYQHPRYARSFAEFGEPVHLPNCDGWLLERTTPGMCLRDAMGCYPIFACMDWQGLDADLAAVSPSLVSLVLVADPFGNYRLGQLEACFDQVMEFKEHWVTDLDDPASRHLPRRHRRSVDRALEAVTVETCGRPADMLDDWLVLYRQLTARHGIQGIRAFSRKAFAIQLETPGLVMFRASVDGETVGLHQWMVHGGVAYGHLGATSTRGYDTQAAYALYWHAREYFRGGVGWLDLGSAPGSTDQHAHGLIRFKKGWATGRRPSYLCMRVFQPDNYRALCEVSIQANDAFFPAYRHNDYALEQTESGL